MKKNICIALLHALLPCMLSGQMITDSAFVRVETNLLAQLYVYPQEKIHLHTDRDFYVPGEKIWFKAYVIDAITHLSPTFSRYVYAELIDARDSLVSRVMIRPENEMFYGHIFLSEIIPEGDYTLRAYTRYLENLGDDYFFKKNIRIGALMGRNPAGPDLPSAPDTFGNSAQVTNRRGQRPGTRNQKPETMHNDFDVSFFPEGGNQVQGIINKIAFKAINKNGFPESISGQLVDEDGFEIASIETVHAGMGVFNYVPMPEKRYFLKCRNRDGLEKQFELPQSDPRACSLTAMWRNKRLLIGVQQSGHAPELPVYLLIHSRGLPVYFSEWDQGKGAVTLMEEQLPAGVIQIVLFDHQMNPLSERLVFSKNNDMAKVEFQTNKPNYEKRDNVIMTLFLTDFDGNILLPGHLSVAVTDDTDIAVDSSTTILSSLLISSELRGYIENPAWYLQDDPASEIALDYLMLTHGWRRYNIPEAVKGNLAYPQIPVQESQALSGHVKSLVLSRPVPNSEISILSKAGFLGLTTSDASGAFLFNDFELPDSAYYFVQALNSRGSDRVKLEIDRESFPALVYAPQSPRLAPGEGFIGKDTKNESETNAFIAKAEQRSMYDDDMRIIHLSEVEVTAPRIERKEEARLAYWMNSGSDVTIRRAEFERTGAIQNVTDLLRTVAGVRISSNGYIYIRESGNLGGGYLPLILIDGMPFDWPDTLNSIYDSPLEMVNVNDVESIDVFKGASAAMFGVRGAGGAISITTRRGGDGISNGNEGLNYIIYTPLGYQEPVEFYSPVYETLESRYLNIPDYRTTIFWKPDVVVSEEGEATLEFYASDFPTTYSVVIEGLTTDGQIVRQVEKIHIK